MQRLTETGRALAIGASTTFDLEDDLQGLNAGQVMRDFILQGEGGPFEEMLGQRP